MSFSQPSRLLVIIAVAVGLLACCSKETCDDEDGDLSIPTDKFQYHVVVPESLGVPLMLGEAEVSGAFKSSILIPEDSEKDPYLVGDAGTHLGPLLAGQSPAPDKHGTHLFPHELVQGQVGGDSQKWHRHKPAVAGGLRPPPDQTGYKQHQNSQQVVPFRSWLAEEESGTIAARQAG